MPNNSGIWNALYLELCGLYGIYKICIEKLLLVSPVILIFCESGAIGLTSIHQVLPTLMNFKNFKIFTKINILCIVYKENISTLQMSCCYGCIDYSVFISSQTECFIMIHHEAFLYMFVENPWAVLFDLRQLELRALD